MSGVQSIDRTLILLETIAKHDNGISLAELSELTELHKSTVHRLVGALIKHNYVLQTEDLKYKISYKLFQLGSNAFSNISIIDTAKESIEWLSEEIQEVVHLVVRNGNQIIYIDKENSGRNSAIMGSRIGSTAPLYCTSVGKAMLFNSSKDDMKEVWDNSDIKNHTENTITEFNEFIQDIELSKKRGYAIDDEENELGIRCFGAPIFNYKNEIVGAISLSGPVARVNMDQEKKFSEPLKKAAEEISLKLGYFKN